MTVTGILIQSDTYDYVVTVDKRGLPDLLFLAPTGEWRSLKETKQAAAHAREILAALGVDYEGYNHTQQLLKALVVIGLNRVTQMFFSAARW